MTVLFQSKFHIFPAKNLIYFLIFICAAIAMFKVLEMYSEELGFEEVPNSQMIERNKSNGN